MAASFEDCTSPMASLRCESRASCGIRLEPAVATNFAFSIGSAASMLVYNRHSSGVRPLRLGRCRKGRWVPFLAGAARVLAAARQVGHCGDQEHPWQKTQMRVEAAGVITRGRAGCRETGRREDASTTGRLPIARETRTDAAMILFRILSRQIYRGGAGNL